MLCAILTRKIIIQIFIILMMKNENKQKAHQIISEGGTKHVSGRRLPIPVLDLAHG